jgi:type IX secretion system PorP/SprF family membrane protein
MMKTTLRIFPLLILTSILGVEGSLAQDPLLSNFTSMPMYYNPATCASNDDLDFRLTYRNAWYKLKPMFQTSFFSASYLAPRVGGLGIMAMADFEGAGFLQTNQVGFCYAKHLPLVYKKLSLHFGLMSSFVQKSIEWSNLDFMDEYDKVLGKVYTTGFVPPARNSTIYPDFNAGVMINLGSGENARQSTKYFNQFGFSASHLTRPDHSLIGIGSRLPMKFVAHYKGVYLHHLKHGVYTAPAAVYEWQATMSTMTFGANVMFDPVYLGLWARNRRFADMNTYDALSISAGVVLDQRFDYRVTISYHYDFTISRLAPGVLGSHEISIAFSQDVKRKTKHILDPLREVPCTKQF